MEAMFIYLLKASGILLIFHIAYEVLLKKETFFIVNRLFLITGIILALILPAVVITNYIEVEMTATSPVLLSNTGNNTAAETVSGLDTMAVLRFVFLAGLIVMSGRFLMQLFSIRKMIRAHRIRRKGGIKMVEIDRDVAPFSFFNYIFYNPGQYESEELEAIMEHERAHCQQWHSVDIVLAQLVLLFMWLNPVCWLYLKNIQQNLEFLADRQAKQNLGSGKTYEYTMLKISGNLRPIPVTNNFYNSLIKKRIVMLHQSKSKKINIMKTFLILPVLALFLWSFNTVEVYIPSGPQFESFTPAQANEALQSIKFTIDKNTTDAELKEIKDDLASKDVDFSYTVVHNEKKEIIEIDLSLSSSSDSGNSFIGSSSFQNDGKPIDPITIVFNGDGNVFFMGNNGDSAVVHKEIKHSTWVHSDADAHQTIEIIKEDGKEVIKVDGKKVSRKELEKMKKDGKIHKGHITIKADGDDAHTTTIIKMDHDGDHDVRIDSKHDVEIISSDGGGFFFMNGDMDGDPLFILDGKEVDRDAIKDLDSDDIETMNVLKGEKAKEKYGEKAKDGVIEITTKD